ncbi:MAG: zf-HC2 domain-containing protein, partial [Chloroflexota bacterium]
MLFGWGRKKTDCEWAQPLLSPYLDSQVSVEERRRLEAHLRDCASCSQELASLKLAVSLLNRVPAVPAPRSFTISIPEAVRRPVLSPAFFYLRNATAAMATVFVVLMAGGFALEAWQPVYTTGAPAYRGAEEQIALQQDQGKLTDKAQFGLAPTGDTEQPGYANATTPAPAPEPTRATAAAPLAAAPMATRQESGDAVRRAPPEAPPQPAAAPAPPGSGAATAEPPTQPGAAEPARK